jgi:hypothetical protein
MRGQLVPVKSRRFRYGDRAILAQFVRNAVTTQRFTLPVHEDEVVGLCIAHRGRPLAPERGFARQRTQKALPPLPVE